MGRVGSSHGNGSPAVLEAIVCFILDLIPGLFFGHLFGHATGLYHESLYYPMENCPIIESALNVEKEIFNAFRSSFTVQLQYDIALGGFQAYFWVGR